MKPTESNGNKQAVTSQADFQYLDNSEDEIDLFELWGILWDGRWWVIGAGFLCSVIAIVYALTATEIYEARVVMVPADDGGQSGGLAALAGQFGGLASLAGINVGSGGGQTATALATLESFAFTTEFIDEKELLPVLYAEQWDSKLGVWRGPGEDKPSLQAAAKLFADSVRSVSTDKTSGATTLTISWSDPDLVAKWANELVKKLNEVVRDRDVQEASRAMEYLRNQVATTANVDMQQTLFRLIEAQTKTIMLASVRDDYVFRVVDPAYAPETRSKPKRSLIVVLGGMLGGLLGIMAVFGRQVVRSYKERS